MAGHRSLLKLALQNLVSNAIKFVLPGQQPRVRVTATCGEGIFRLMVEDNGIGIEPSKKEMSWEHRFGACTPGASSTAPALVWRSASVSPSNMAGGLRSKRRQQGEAGSACLCGSPDPIDCPAVTVASIALQANLIYTSQRNSARGVGQALFG